MNCRRATTLIIEYEVGAPDFMTILASRGHLLDCSDCVAFLETYRKTIELTRSLPSEELSPEAQSRIRRFLDRRIKHPSSTL